MSHFPRLLRLCGLLLLSGAASSAAAQEAPRTWCFRPAPVERCRSFLLIEIRGQSPFVQPYRTVTIDGTHTGADGAVQEIHDRILEKELSQSFGWELGYAWNVGNRWAIGAAAGYELAEASRRRTVSLRIRRWLGDAVALELAPGAFQLFEVGYEPDEKRIGASVAARLVLWDAAVLALRWDMVPVEGHRSEENGIVVVDPGGLEQNLSAGLGLESMTGLVGTGVGFLAWMVLLGGALSAG